MEGAGQERESTSDAVSTASCGAKGVIGIQQSKLGEPFVNIALLMCRDPHSSDWELPFDSTDGVLLGWVVEPESFDGGAPPAVANLLSQLVCRMGIVTYLSHDGVAVPKSKHKVVTTREPSVAAALFDDPAYPWTQYGQAAFLSDDATLQVTSRVLNEVVGQRKASAAERAGFKGVLLPGVDGVVAGLWMFQAGGLDSFVAALEECSELHVLDEEQFRDALRGT